MLTFRESAQREKELSPLHIIIPALSFELELQFPLRRTMRLLGRKHHSEGEASGLRVSELGNQMINRRKRGDRHIGLADGARRSQLGPDHLEGSKKERYEKYQGNIPLEDEEKYVRSKVENRPMSELLFFDDAKFTTSIEFCFLMTNHRTTCCITIAFFSIGSHRILHGIENLLTLPHFFEQHRRLCSLCRLDDSLVQYYTRAVC